MSPWPGGYQLAKEKWEKWEKRSLKQVNKLQCKCNKMEIKIKRLASQFLPLFCVCLQDYVKKQLFYLSSLLFPISLATVLKDSLYILGYWLCLKQRISILTWVYFRKTFWVSSESWVLKEFIRTSGMSTPYFLFRYWKSWIGLNITNIQSNMVKWALGQFLPGKREERLEL